MCAALTDTLVSSTSAVLIGTDCPAMTSHDLRAAVQSLQRGKDAVFAPTEDGGYALVAMKRCHPTLFDGIDWGTSAVMEETRARLRAIGWTWEELGILWDVDTPEDYERLAACRLL